MPIIQVRDLGYIYPKASDPAVNGMEFEVLEGEIFGFLGPSGAGKTTTQRILTGLLRGWTGTAEVLGRDVAAWGRDLYREIGVSFELPVGYPRLTAREDLEHFSVLQGADPAGVGSLLDLLGLAESAEAPLATFSKGMRSRHNLARALLHEPRLLFLDEPTGGLDPTNVAGIRTLIERQRNQGRTVFLTTHDMPTAAALCDRVAFVSAGHIVAIDTPRALGLAHRTGRAKVVLTDANGSRMLTLDLDSPELGAALESGLVESIHTEEATLDELFVALTDQDRQ
jgi:fluoroquinolone transport system ATP-binding protein